jgi:DNA-binding transcriptional regulator YiaG
MTHGLAELRKFVEHRRSTVELPPPRIRRAIREAAGVAQVVLGSAIGVSGVSVCRYESGAREPHGAVRLRYAEALEELRRA